MQDKGIKAAFGLMFLIGLLYSLFVSPAIHVLVNPQTEWPMRSLADLRHLSVLLFTFINAIVASSYCATVASKAKVAPTGWATSFLGDIVLGIVASLVLQTTATFFGFRSSFGEMFWDGLALGLIIGTVETIWWISLREPITEVSAKSPKQAEPQAT